MSINCLVSWEANSKSTDAFTVQDQQAENIIFWSAAYLGKDRKMERGGSEGQKGWTGRVGGKGRMKSASCGLICPM